MSIDKQSAGPYNRDPNKTQNTEFFPLYHRKDIQKQKEAREKIMSTGGSSIFIFYSLS